MRKSLWIFAVCVIFICAGSVFADTPDGQTPSRETVCDNEEGAAYGLCTAYCEAMDCGDPNQRASDRGCEAVRRNFEKQTGRPIPCGLNCPCSDQLVLFAQIVAGTVGVQRCIADDTLLLVVTDQGDTAFIEDGVSPNCNVNGEPPFIPLSPSEEQVCRVRIREAVEATGVICRRSE
jgi:hypothetical protein